MEALHLFNYNENAITFKNEDGVAYVNATEMCRPFGKRPSKWLELTSSKRFLTELETVRKTDSLIKTIEGVNGGTWMHEDVALEFSRWLSPAFSIWCNDRIKELLKHGVTASDDMVEKMLNDPEAFLKVVGALSEERKAKRALETMLEAKEEQLRLQTNEIVRSVPKVQYYDNVLQSNTLYTATQMAKQLGFRNVQGFNKRLHELGVQFFQSGQWMLTANYSGRGYTKDSTYTHESSTGGKRSSTTMKWTERGREFLHNLADKTRMINAAKKSANS